jgi:type 2 lantibiotic biosynthesis protein LanM
LTGEEHYRALAQAALVNLRAELVQQLKYPEMLSIGAFSGLGSAIYLFSHLGVLWQDRGLFQEAEELVNVLTRRIDSDKNFDIASGAAGAILSLLSLHSASGSVAAYDAAVRCGDHLLQHALDLPAGKGWKNDVGIKPLSGFSHGAAGIALSLIKLAECSKEQRFKELAQAALTYERSLFSEERQNWLTLRTEVEGPRYMIAWCHGAPGVGLARLGMLHTREDPEILSEIQAALQTTEQAFGGNHSLCHGGFGNLEVLLVASQRLPEAYQPERMQRIANWLVQDLEERGWQTGLHFNMQTPSLMVGGSGIGYQLLRLASPEYVPSVLLLEPPVQTRLFH